MDYETKELIREKIQILRESLSSEISAVCLLDHELYSNRLGLGIEQNLKVLCLALDVVEKRARTEVSELITIISGLKGGD